MSGTPWRDGGGVVCKVKMGEWLVWGGEERGGGAITLGLRQRKSRKSKSVRDKGHKVTKHDN